jgi:hypothetical protein
MRLLCLLPFGGSKATLDTFSAKTGERAHVGSYSIKTPLPVDSIVAVPVFPFLCSVEGCVYPLAQATDENFGGDS